jgi:transposase InsO family protein
MLGVSRSGYHDWNGRAPSRRKKADISLTERIKEIDERSRGTYGYPRVHAELRAMGIRCGRKRVARLMRKAGLRGCLRSCRTRGTTRRDGSAISAADPVERDFNAVARAGSVGCGHHLRETVEWQMLLPPQGLVVLPRRWVEERTFAWISHKRRMSKDYERSVHLHSYDSPDGKVLSPCPIVLGSIS